MTGVLGEIEHLRGAEKPELRARLERLYHDGPPRGPAAAQADELEARLLELERRVMTLHATIAEPGVGWERDSGGLRVAELRGRELARGHARLSYVPCNLECVHGPYSMIPLAELASRLLGPDEDIATLARVSWKQPMREAVELVVYDAATPARVAPASVLAGRFVTTSGRALEFVGHACRGQFVTAHASTNQISQQLVSAGAGSFDPGSGIYTIPLASGRLAAEQLERLRSLPTGLATLLDLVSIVILNIHRGVPMLSCGFTDVPVATLVQARVADGLTFELRERRDRARVSPRSGLTIVPYEFRYLPFQRRWGTMIMAEAPHGLAQMNTALRGYAGKVCA
jgi:hypothetical protein